MAPLARFIPRKQEATIDAFFNSSIQSIIKQRDEQPPDQVYFTFYSFKSLVPSAEFLTEHYLINNETNTFARRGVETSFS